MSVSVITIVPFIDYDKQRWCRKCQKAINLDSLVDTGPKGMRCPRCKSLVRQDPRAHSDVDSKARKESRVKRY